MNNSEVDPASFYPSPRPDSEQLSITDSSEVQTNSSQTHTSDAPTLDTDSEIIQPTVEIPTSRHRRSTNPDGSVVVAEEEERPRALPLPLEHIYVHDSERALLLSDFQVIATLGTGTFGRVLLVRLRPESPHHRPDTLQHFAMKVLRKSEVYRLKQVEHVNAERHILARIQHPFIVDLYATFQDHLNVYMLLSYVPGGELFTLLRRAGRFTPDVTRFYLGGIVLALRYLHSYNIIYRDLKPENLLLDHRGYLRITDFGFAKVVDDRTWTLCGTPEYLAPEIIQSSGHGKAVDWWACGILAYEMMVGYPPFFDDNPFGIYEKIIRGKIHWPKEMDVGSREFIKAFLNPDRSKRLGNLRGGAEDVLRHPWFSGVDWAALEAGEIQAPLVPQVRSPEDTQYFADLPLPEAPEVPGLFPNSKIGENPVDEIGFLFLDF